jgi:hypothetical protein
MVKASIGGLFWSSIAPVSNNTVFADTSFPGAGTLEAAVWPAQEEKERGKARTA